RVAGRRRPVRVGAGGEPDGGGPCLLERDGDGACRTAPAEDKDVGAVRVDGARDGRPVGVRPDDPAAVPEDERVDGGARAGEAVRLVAKIGHRRQLRGWDDRLHQYDWGPADT